MNEVLDEARQLEKLHELETVVRTGFRQFLEVGRALAEIKEARLYQAEGYRSFAGYVKSKFNYNLSYCNYLMNTAELIRRLEDLGDDTIAVPSTEAQCKALAPLIRKEKIDDEKIDRVRQVLAKVKEEETQPSAKAIHSAIAELYPETLPPERNPEEFNARAFGNSLNTICCQMRNIREDDLKHFFADQSRAEQKEHFITEIRKFLLLLEADTPTVEVSHPTP